MDIDPIVLAMIEDAKAGGVINRRAHLTDPKVVLDMINRERRRDKDRRKTPRGTPDRRKAKR